MLSWSDLSLHFEAKRAAKSRTLQNTTPLCKKKRLVRFLFFFEPTCGWELRQKAQSSKN
jgi:hypothetical protein